MPDHLDQCPGTPRGAKVNENGCWVSDVSQFWILNSLHGCNRVYRGHLHALPSAFSCTITLQGNIVPILSSACRALILEFLNNPCNGFAERNFHGFAKIATHKAGLLTTYHRGNPNPDRPTPCDIASGVCRVFWKARWKAWQFHQKASQFWRG